MTPRVSHRVKKRPPPAARAREPGVLVLPQTLASQLEAGHRWVYRTHVPKDFRAPSGSWIQIRAGRFVGYALWDDESPVALRVFSRHEKPDAQWIRARVREAWSLRSEWLSGTTDAFRLLYGEGDGLPGVVVDYYAGYCVLVTYATSLEGLVDPIVRALMEFEPVRGVVRRGHETKGRLQVLAGQAPPHDLVVTEGDWRLAVNLSEGQKTGLFLDHRDNRLFVAKRAKGASVLNLFCYTGAFSLAALSGGASRVTSVDVALPSIRAARDNFALNGHDPEKFEFVAADVFAYLEQARSRGERFDLVISDPPSFAKRRDQQRPALKAYRKLAMDGLRVTRSGGIYVGASCTSQVSADQFRQTLAEAAQRTNRRLQLLHEAFHAVDHPVFIGHPEGRYLKCFVTRVLDPC